MGASSAEIDQEIRDTRGELDKNLEVLERRAARGARVYGLIAAGVAVGVGAVVVGALVYRRRQQKKVAKQLHHVLFDSLRDLPESVKNKLKKNLPVTVVFGERADEASAGNPWSALAAKVAPTLVGSATGAVMARLRGAPAEGVAAE
jgi:ABC-type branched-subunit amino acid transport system permease subunit